MFQEKKRHGMSGWLMLPTLLVILGVTIYLIIASARAQDAWGALGWTLAMVVTIVCFVGLVVVNPNEGVVLQLFGPYKGTLREAGFLWVNPLMSKKRISLRIRNFETSKLKVNDNDGNPIEIAAVVVWQVVDTAEAVFNVDNYEDFVHVQSEAALRNLAMAHPYDTHSDMTAVALRSHTNEIAQQLKKELQDRLEKAGVLVNEARISHLAYAPEIAGAMLRRQQASAIVAARQKFVEGAVGMVEMALEMLGARGVVKLDEERRAAMVSNMLVVLCSDQSTQPVVNTGTIYQ